MVYMVVKNTGSRVIMETSSGLVANQPHNLSHITQPLHALVCQSVKLGNDETYLLWGYCENQMRKGVLSCEPSAWHLVNSEEV